MIGFKLSTHKEGERFMVKQVVAKAYVLILKKKWNMNSLGARLLGGGFSS